jgi:hypothetical protein
MGSSLFTSFFMYIDTILAVGSYLVSHKPDELQGHDWIISVSNLVGNNADEWTVIGCQASLVGLGLTKILYIF